MRNQGAASRPLRLAQLDYDVGAGLASALRKGAHEGRPYPWSGG